MIDRIPIKCSKCDTIVIEDQQNLSNFVISADIRCPVCGAIVIAAPRNVC